MEPTERLNKREKKRKEKMRREKSKIMVENFKTENTCIFMF